MSHPYWSSRVAPTQTEQVDAALYEHMLAQSDLRGAQAHMQRAIHRLHDLAMYADPNNVRRINRALNPQENS